MARAFRPRCPICRRGMHYVQPTISASTLDDINMYGCSNCRSVFVVNDSGTTEELEKAKSDTDGRACNNTPGGGGVHKERGKASRKRAKGVRGRGFAR